MRITFLGTGGGRFATISQKRMTGGFRIDNISGFNQYLPIRNVSFTAKTGVYDPITGALVNNKL